jgi:hypothetical protein
LFCKVFLLLKGYRNNGSLFSAVTSHNLNIG